MDNQLEVSVLRKSADWENSRRFFGSVDSVDDINAEGIGREYVCDILFMNGGIVIFVQQILQEVNIIGK